MATSAFALLPHPIFAFTSSLRRASPLISSSAKAANFSLTLTTDSDNYGPSLHRGQRPTPAGGGTGSCDCSDSDYCTSLDRSSFSRTFNIAAIRIPASECSALEGRLRGHLLNWPRIRNVARVTGDDIDPDIESLFLGSESDGGYRLLSIARRSAGGGSDNERETLSPVLYREKLAKEFNCRGYLKFRNLAKMSRPRKKKMKRAEGERVRVRNGPVKNNYAVVEILGENEEIEDDMSGLLGDEFRAGSWRGSTRLLLLDERYADKGIDELPEAIKLAALKEGIMVCRLPLPKLVRCQLTLFYDYWLMNEVLETLLPEGVTVPTGFETVGHIAHLNLSDEHLPYKKLIGQVVLDKNRPKIKTVVNKVDAIQNDYRTMQLEILAGNHSLVTTIIENGNKFQVDLAKVYWNSRLATERQRLVSCFASSDVVCDVFSGVGPITISAAKIVKYVYSNDLNPDAVEYLERNVVLNKLDRKIEVFNMDGMRFVESLFSSQPSYPITQVVMNLPNDAVEFLAAFRGIFRRRGSKAAGCKLPRIHVYGFSKAVNPDLDFHERINIAMCETVVDLETHRVRLVAPGKWMLCASFILPKNVAFAQESC